MEVRSIVPSKKQRLLLAEEVQRNHAALKSDAECSQLGREFLLSRGITEDMQDRWRLGYVEQGTYRGRISIPYWTPAGYSGMVYRCLHLPGVPCKELDHHEKYLALPGYRPMFNVRALSIGADRVFIAEGELNAVVATYFGYPCVAVGGAKSWKPWWSYCFDGPREIVVLQDGDAAGSELVERVRHELRHVTAIEFPSDHDVSSLYVEQGEDALHKIIRGALDG